MASKRHLRRKMCGDKIRYETDDEARAARRDACLAFGTWMTTYPCDFCGGFHIGHPPKKVRQAIAARRRGELE